MTECDSILRREIKQELRREIRRDFKNKWGRFSGKKVLFERMNFQEEAEHGCRGGYHTAGERRERRQQREGVSEIKTTEERS